MNIVSHSIEETQKFAKTFLEEIKDKYGNIDEALVIGFSGHLGAGKTAFVKCLAKEMGVKEDITSPTFVIMKIYETNHSVWKRLIHIDAYRLEKKEEVEALRFEDIISNKNNLVLVEWPENIELESFGEKIRLKFEMNDGVVSIDAGK